MILDWRKSFIKQNSKKTVTQKKVNFLEAIFLKNSPKDLQKKHISSIKTRQASEASLPNRLASSKRLIDEKNQILQNTVKDLQKTKEAMLNILEDLEISKQKVEQEKRKYEAILESIGDGIIFTDKFGKIVHLNPVAEELLTLKINSVSGKLFNAVIRAEDEHGTLVEKDQRALHVALTTRKKITTNYFYVLPNKTKIPVYITVTPVILNGQVIGGIEVFRDITKELEVDRMKSEFISLVSHQLRTPLSAMKWFLEMLISGDAGALNPEQKQFIKNIDNSNQRMIELVNALLNVSRIESGRIIVDPKLTDLNDLIEGVVREIKNKLDEKKQKLIISINEGIPLIYIDPKLIRQIYMNLLTNAIKYTPAEGEISIFVSKDDKEIISQITDTGYGIPKEDKHKVFSKFYRGTNISKLVTDGNGLGLYLVKSIVESSHGKIWYESKEGKGTTFWFTLPLSGMEPRKGEVTLDD